MQSATNVAVDLSEHGSAILRVLTELRPRAVAGVELGARFEPRLAEYAGALGFEPLADPARADLAISGASTYESVRTLLSQIRERPAVAVLGGTGWPCGRRDARASVDDLETDERLRYAFRCPVPGELALSDESSPVAFATVEGGPRNGVRTAIEDACRDAPGVWDVRLLPGFGGIAIMLPAALASAERWAAIAPAGLAGETLSRLELANVQLRLDRERLLRELDARDRSLDETARAMRQAVADCEDRLAAALGEADRSARELTSRVASDRDERRRLEQRVATATRDMQASAERERERAQGRERALAAEQAARRDIARILEDERTAGQRWEAVVRELGERLQERSHQLERQALAHHRELTRLARAHAEERAFVIELTTRIATSGTWRWGHRLAKAKARLTFHSYVGTDAVTRLLERVTTTSTQLEPAAAASEGSAASLAPRLAAGRDLET